MPRPRKPRARPDQAANVVARLRGGLRAVYEPGTGTAFLLAHTAPAAFVTGDLSRTGLTQEELDRVKGRTVTIPAGSHPMSTVNRTGFHRFSLSASAAGQGIVLFNFMNLLTTDLAVAAYSQSTSLSSAVPTGNMLNSSPMVAPTGFTFSLGTASFDASRYAIASGLDTARIIGAMVIVRNLGPALDRGGVFYTAQMPDNRNLLHAGRAGWTWNQLIDSPAGRRIPVDIDRGEVMRMVYAFQDEDVYRKFHGLDVNHRWCETESQGVSEPGPNTWNCMLAFDMPAGYEFEFEICSIYEVNVASIGAPLILGGARTTDEAGVKRIVEAAADHHVTPGRGGKHPKAGHVPSVMRKVARAAADVGRFVWKNREEIASAVGKAAQVANNTPA